MLVISDTRLMIGDYGDDKSREGKERTPPMGLSIKDKKRVLELVDQQGFSVTDACEQVGCSRDSYYRFRALLKDGGVTALGSRKRRSRGDLAVAKGVPKAVVRLAFQYPAWGPERVSRELAKKGHTISASEVRSVWRSYDLDSKWLRLDGLQAKMRREEVIRPSPAAKVALRRFGADIEQHLDFRSPAPGYYGVQSSMKVQGVGPSGVGFLNVFIDTYSNLVFGQFGSRKSPSEAKRLLEEKVLPLLDEYSVTLRCVMVDRGTEFRGLKGEANEYGRFLRSKGIRCTQMMTRTTHTREVVDRFFDEVVSGFLTPNGRRFEGCRIEIVRGALGRWLEEYNERRAYLGRWCYGKPPMRVFKMAVEAGLGGGSSAVAFELDGFAGPIQR